MNFYVKIWNFTQIVLCDIGLKLAAIVSTNNCYLFRNLCHHEVTIKCIEDVSMDDNKVDGNVSTAGDSIQINKIHQVKVFVCKLFTKYTLTIFIMKCITELKLYNKGLWCRLQRKHSSWNVLNYRLIPVINCNCRFSFN